ncbi:MAG: hypothetical protein KJ970_05950 [Candidatus Eisenbacteria bacterium]|uniref:VapC45 PIN like domain-containing protein n=1 Tax=Eiseniibacteriota bacterium TaxID=2212470 RepID=A0A948RSZ8_UNCEI|nr:hypothetical protein [Candidatus Eisenbacteria bacterium]MBU1949380.1 hypothetical protein [Candidatus Eisenbacteria bacterium]MBU2690453.1 hypothetical protein [Candidatus Eisenbacteria bacterium]
MSPVFFTDRDLGKVFPGVLAEAGISVESHHEHFSEMAPDEEWLANIGKREWFAISHDRKIRYKPNERDAVMHFGVGLFILIGKVSTKALALNFVNTYGKILGFIENHERPFIAKIYMPSGSSLKTPDSRPGRVEMYLSYDKWDENQ